MYFNNSEIASFSPGKIYQLVKNGVNLNATDSFGRTIFHNIKFESESCIVMAMALGFNYLHRDNNGNTIFHSAYNPQILSSLVNNGNFFLETVNNFGQTIFHTQPEYINNFSNEIDYFLLNATVPDFSNASIETVRKMFLKGYNPNVIDADGNTAFHLLALNSNVENFQQILSIGLEYGLDPLIKNKNGKTIHEMEKADSEFIHDQFPVMYCYA